MWIYNYNDPNELYHFGIKGMKWGVRRSKTGYRSTGLRSAVARRKNDRVDASFKDWNDNAKKKQNAIEIGNKAAAAKVAYDANKGDKSLKQQHKQTSKEYKKALKSNTTYRKGLIKNEVGKTAARKYLSEAKKVKATDKKKYQKLMNKYDVERANARKAPEVAARRSRKKASIKRALTISAKTMAATAAVGVGVHYTNKYLKDHNVTLNGQDFRITPDKIRKFNNAVNVGKGIFRYV